jgi:hypothetical protein
MSVNGARGITGRSIRWRKCATDFKQGWQWFELLAYPIPEPSKTVDSINVVSFRKDKKGQMSLPKLPLAFLTAGFVCLERIFQNGNIQIVTSVPFIFNRLRVSIFYSQRFMLEFISIHERLHKAYLLLWRWQLFRLLRNLPPFINPKVHLRFNKKSGVVRLLAPGTRKRSGHR